MSRRVPISRPLARLEAGPEAAFGNLKPRVGVALAVALLGEPLATSQVGALVLLGVGVASGPGISGRLGVRREDALAPFRGKRNG